MPDSSQKFISRNRPPRADIVYVDETFGSPKKIDLPHVTGVLSDLSGKPAEDFPPLAKRKMKDIDIDNFDERLRSESPRVAFRVPNRLTGKGELPVDITFERLDDFSPARVASKVDPLRQLLAARTQLVNLLTYMDGKAGAEDLIARTINDPALLQTLVAQQKSDSQIETDSREKE